MIDWILMTLSVGGALLNAHRYKEGFLVWIVANTGWSVVAVYNEMWSQIPMWTVYSIISVMGYRKWTNEREKP
jgi:membrane protein implicated in regulation of membrane protease activity